MSCRSGHELVHRRCARLARASIVVASWIAGSLGQARGGRKTGWSGREGGRWVRVEGSAWGRSTILWVVRVARLTIRLRRSEWRVLGGMELALVELGALVVRLRLTNVLGLPVCAGLCTLCTVCTFGTGAGGGIAVPLVPAAFAAAFLTRKSANLFFSSSGVSILIFLDGRPCPGGGFPVALKRSSWAAQ